jgi:Tol biopolymer transport system component
MTADGLRDCPFCSDQHPIDSRFCPTTSRKLPPVCPKCGSAVKPKWNRCQECGADLRSGMPPVPLDESGDKEQLRKYLPWVIMAVAVLIGVFAVYYVSCNVMGWVCERPAEEYVVVATSEPDTPVTGVIFTQPPTDTPPTTLVDPASTPTPSTQGAVVPPAPSEPPAPSGPEPLPPSSSGSPWKDWVMYAYGDFVPSREIHFVNPYTGEDIQVTSNVYRDDTPSMSPGGKEIVYASNRDARWQLYVLNLESRQERQITSVPGQAREPSWSQLPGDDRIAFELREPVPGSDDFLRNIWIVRSDGSGLEQLTASNLDVGPSWSPDGSRIAFVRALQDSDGNGQVTVNDRTEIFNVDVETHQVTRVTTTPYDNFDVDWSPDGQWIIFCSIRGDANGDSVTNLDDSRNLYRIHPDGTGEEVLYLGDLVTFDPGWKYDSRTVVFGVDLGINVEELWIADWEDQSVERITPSGLYFYPAWGR